MMYQINCNASNLWPVRDILIYHCFPLEVDINLGTPLEGTTLEPGWLAKLNPKFNKCFQLVACS
jgi:hypothetical protein